MQNHLEQIISPHHQCVIAGNGEEGLRMALDYIPDIIISDVMMSGMDGFDLLKAIKSNELTAYIPVIMLTARADNQSKLKGLRAEADDYLTKPFDANELLLRLSNQLKSRTKLQQKLTRQWHFSISKQDEQPAETNEEKFVLQLNAIFEAHYSDPDIPMSFIATKLAMSERQLQRKVKMLLGVSPLEALRQFRLERAKELLKQQKQVGFTAQACGFSSQSYFGRCFKDYVGMTPREYQKQQNQHK
jgi:YesN/AraC family two-component response regulator